MHPKQMSFLTYLTVVANMTEGQRLDYFKHYLTEAEKKKKKIPKPKPRPKKVLWFGDKNFWHNDLQFAHGGKFQYHASQEQEENSRSIYAVDPSGSHCYGVWQGGRNRGVTFHRPRPLHAVKHPRSVIKQLASTTPSNIKK